MSVPKLKTPKQRYTQDELPEAQKREILRRETDFQSGKIKAEPWEEVRKRFIK